MKLSNTQCATVIFFFSLSLFDSSLGEVGGEYRWRSEYQQRAHATRVTAHEAKRKESKQSRTCPLYNRYNNS